MKGVTPRVRHWLTQWQQAAPEANTHFGRHKYRLAAGIRWHLDCARLPLTDAHKPLYKLILKSYYTRFGRFPDIAHGQTFNEIMQWLKLFDQSTEVANCCDKLHARDYISKILGNQYLPALLQTADRFDDLDFDALPNQFVLKTNHDSGTIFLVRDKIAFDVATARARIEWALAKPDHGWAEGEWGYKYVKRKVFAETFLAPENPTPPPDYKFHCSGGKVRFVHFLYDRGHNTKEQLLSISGEDLDVRLAAHYPSGKAFKKPEGWEKMLSIAEQLSKDFAYVRVDQYNIDGRIYVGELTFWPYAGVYKTIGQGQEILGRMLQFDRSNPKPIFDRRR